MNLDFQGYKDNLAIYGRLWKIAPVTGWEKRVNRRTWHPGHIRFLQTKTIHNDQKRETMVQDISEKLLSFVTVNLKEQKWTIQ